MMSEITWHDAHLMAIRAYPQSWPDYCPRCGVEDDRPASAHDLEFHVDETVAAMREGAARPERGFAFVASAETMRDWLTEAARLDLAGVPRSPMPHENHCPEFDHSRPCSRQEGHSGGHSTQY